MPFGLTRGGWIRNQQMLARVATFYPLPRGHHNLSTDDDPVDSLAGLVGVTVFRSRCDGRGVKHDNISVGTELDTTFLAKRRCTCL